MTGEKLKITFKQLSWPNLHGSMAFAGLEPEAILDLMRLHFLSVEVGCDFCGAQYRFDAVDAAQIFTQPLDHPPGFANMQ